MRVIVGTAALLALAAVFALAVGAVLRRSAGAVTVVIAAIVLPYFLAVASVLPTGAGQWLLRITPAAAFAIQQTVTQYPQVAGHLPPGQRLLPARALGRLRRPLRLHRSAPSPSPSSSLRRRDV